MLAFVAMPFYLENHFGYSAVQIGLLITPWPIAVAFAAPIAGWLVERYPAGLLGGIVEIDRPLVFGIQVMVGEHIQIGIQGLRRTLVASQLQAQRRHLGGTQVVVTLGAAQAIA